MAPRTSTTVVLLVGVFVLPFVLHYMEKRDKSVQYPPERPHGVAQPSPESDQMVVFVQYPGRGAAVKITCERSLAGLVRSVQSHRAMRDVRGGDMKYLWIEEGTDGGMVAVQLDEVTWETFDPVEQVVTVAIGKKDIDSRAQFQKAVEGKEPASPREPRTRGVGYDPRQLQRGTPWTTDTNWRLADEKCPAKRRPYHILVTCSSDSAYEKWLVRIAYYWYKRQKALDPCGEMGGFTRLLSGTPDDIMDEIPTVTVEVLKDNLGFIVLNRPHGFAQWLRKLDDGSAKLDEEYVLVCEPDQFLLKPLPNVAPAGFHFGYMHAREGTIQEEAVQPFLERYSRNYSALSLPPTGPSPCLLHIDDWRRLTPLWHEISFSLQRTEKARKAYTWVLEMWGFISALVANDIRINVFDHLQMEPASTWGKEVAADEQQWSSQAGVGPFLFHVTYGMEFKLDGKPWISSDEDKEAPWSFNKRNYPGVYPPRNLTPPPPAVDHVPAHLVVDMVNTASAAIDTWGKNSQTGRDTCHKKFASECAVFKSKEVMKRLHVGESRS
eukprot:Sspe_Gene.38869::Locus_18745_Transcript_1_1_Confidence_1.000_Length_1852::g.38869::m.38869/K20782/HPAT; hydroxyproline O-arabinosyltransferase